MADDLRDAIAALKIAGVVERIGDYAKNIARRVRDFRRRAKSSRCRCSRDGQDRTGMVHDVLIAFDQRDPNMARAVCKRDDALDDFYESIFRTLLTYMMEDPQNIGPSTTLLFVAKNLERIGDHATNIAEMVYSPRPANAWSSRRTERVIKLQSPRIRQSHYGPRWALK